MNAIKELEVLKCRLENMEDNITDLITGLKEDSFSRTRRPYQRIMEIKDPYSFEDDIIDRIKTIMSNVLWCESGGE